MQQMAEHPQLVQNMMSAPYTQVGTWNYLWTTSAEKIIIKNILKLEIIWFSCRKSILLFFSSREFVKNGLWNPSVHPCLCLFAAARVVLMKFGTWLFFTFKIFNYSEDSCQKEVLKLALYWSKRAAKKHFFYFFLFWLKNGERSFSFFVWLLRTVNI